MRFAHLGDLHIGKRVNGFSLLEDQAFILERIVAIVRAESADAVVISGDVYDKAVPSVEALRVFEGFLQCLAGLDVPVLVVPGNHDSPERLSFGSRFMEGKRLFVARPFSATPQRVRLHDTHGPVDFHLLPFVKPVYVHSAYPDADLTSYGDAVREALAHMEIDPSARSVLVAHQFVVAGSCRPETCDSEVAPIGGVEEVDAALFDGFSYVALGHLHRAQSVGRPETRYCGSPLKYSFSEAGHRKTLTMASLGASGEIKVEEHLLKPLRDMREARGSIEELRSRAVGEGDSAFDYLHVTLTDDRLMDAMAKVRAFYPRVMRLDFARSSDAVACAPLRKIPRSASLPELFADFYAAQTGEALDVDEAALVTEAWGEGRAR